MESRAPEFVCHRCQRNTPSRQPEGWRCVCGGAWELPPGPAFDPAGIDPTAPGIWRYRRQLRVPGPGISLGEGHAPGIPMRNGPVAVCAHLEPTGSFKDRGAAVLATWARHAARPPVIEDSSGNAGGALAAYAAAAGLACRVYVPATAPAPKLRLLRSFGAEVVEVPGPRARAADAAQADSEGTYCSHAWNPVFIEGIKTLAFELWERSRGELPGQVWVPAGQGSLVLGLDAGFGELASGVPGFVRPAIIAVQHRAIAPLAGDDLDDDGEPSASPLADGIAVPSPVRRQAVLRALRGSGGCVVTVDDEDVRRAVRRLGSAGIWVEPTGAVSLAGHVVGNGDSDALVVLTGHGLKGT